MSTLGSGSDKECPSGAKTLSMEKLTGESRIVETP